MYFSIICLITLKYSCIRLFTQLFNQLSIHLIVYCHRYFQSFLRSEFHCKYQIDILTSGRVYLADILYNDSATFYFMEVSLWRRKISHYHHRDVIVTSI